MLTSRNKLFFSLLIFIIAVGDCVLIKGGVFKGSYWKVIAVNKDGTYDIQQKSKDPEHNPTWTIREVRGSYVTPADQGQCK